MESASPKVSFGLPVRNREAFVGRAIESVLGQTLGDVEVVISDNASTDGTPEVCRAYAQRDPRVRYLRNERDVGVLENFNRLVGLARGEYYRWLGSDDWVEPDYAAACAAALDANPHCIAATTYQMHLDDEGGRFYVEYEGPRVASRRPHERFARMLWFLHQDHWLMDPIFSLFRREALARTRLHRTMARADRILAAELSLAGPWCHVPRCLSNRRIRHESEAGVAKRVRPPGVDAIPTSPGSRLAALFDVIREAPITPSEALRCRASALLFFARDLRYETWTQWRPRLAAAAKGVGITPARLRARSGRPRERD